MEGGVLRRGMPTTQSSEPCVEPIDSPFGRVVLIGGADGKPERPKNPTWPHLGRSYIVSHPIFLKIKDFRAPGS